MKSFWYVESMGVATKKSKCDQIKMRDYMDRRVTPPKRVTSPTWGPPPPCKQTAEDAEVSHKSSHTVLVIYIKSVIYR